MSSLEEDIISCKCTRRRSLNNAEVGSFFQGIDLRPLLKKRDKVLELGCGVGRTVRDMAMVHGILPYGIDLADFRKASESLDYYGDDILNLALGNLESLPYKTETFDFAFSFFTFRYVGDKLKALQEAHRVLKLGGTAVIDLADMSKPQYWLESGFEPGIEEIFSHFTNGDQLKLDAVPIREIHGDFICFSYRLTINKTSSALLDFPSLKKIKPFDEEALLTSAVYDPSFLEK